MPTDWCRETEGGSGSQDEEKGKCEEINDDETKNGEYHPHGEEDGSGEEGEGEEEKNGELVLE